MPNDPLVDWDWRFVDFFSQYCETPSTGVFHGIVEKIVKSPERQRLRNIAAIESNVQPG
jgi:hypothetical protein